MAFRTRGWTMLGPGPNNIRLEGLSSERESIVRCEVSGSKFQVVVEEIRSNDDGAKPEVYHVTLKLVT